MPKSKADNAKLPSAAEMKRMVLAIRYAGLDIKEIEIGPNRIRITTSAADTIAEEELSAFDIWKMSETKES